MNDEKHDGAALLCGDPISEVTTETLPNSEDRWLSAGIARELVAKLGIGGGATIRDIQRRLHVDTVVAMRLLALGLAVLSYPQPPFVIGSGNQETPEHSDTPRRSEAQK